MCGICGIVRGDGRAVDPALLGAMSETLRHRGPDSAGEVVLGEAGLAARRLAIIDLEGGDQPIANEDGRIVVVQNGEIYNHAALRAELEAAGHRFRTPHSDTEVLVHLYEQHGLRFAERLRGMFAVAVWDSERRRLVLARDRFGIKPLYYRDGADFAFASELKALRALPDLSREVDLDALEAFLAFNAIHGPRTIYRAVRKLPPGHVLVREEGAARIERYADERPALEHRDEPWEALADELRERLRDSVRAHLVADVPVGVLLSGGVDSSALAALAAEHGRVSTFSIGFAEKSFSEVELARTIARRYGTDHHELVVEPDAAELLPTIAAAFDEPFADSSALPTYLVSAARGPARQGRALRRGWGRAVRRLRDLRRRHAGDAHRRRRAAALAAGRGAAERLRARPARLQAQALHACRPPPAARASPRLEGDLLGRRARRAPAPRPPGQRRPVGRLPRPLGGDRGRRHARAAAGRRPRDLPRRRPAGEDRPHEHGPLAGAAGAVPRPRRGRARARAAAGGAGARLRRRSACCARRSSRCVGREIARGRKKGFSIPAAAWLRGELEPFAREVLGADRLRRQGYFEPAAVSRLIDEHVDRREDHSRQLWGLITFSLWLEPSRG